MTECELSQVGKMPGEVTMLDLSRNTISRLTPLSCSNLVNVSRGVFFCLNSFSLVTGNVKSGLLDSLCVGMLLVVLISFPISSHSLL